MKKMQYYLFFCPKINKIQPKITPKSTFTAYKSNQKDEISHFDSYFSRGAHADRY